MVEETIVQETDGKSAANAGANQSNRVFSVDILRLIRDAQKQHGLRHGDYQRYRGMGQMQLIPIKANQVEIRISLLSIQFPIA